MKKRWQRPSVSALNPFRSNNGGYEQSNGIVGAEQSI